MERACSCTSQQFRGRPAEWLGTAQVNASFVVLPSALSPVEVAAIRALTEDEALAFDEVPDSVDGMPSYEMFVFGKETPVDVTPERRRVRQRLSAIMQNALERRLTPYVRQRSFRRADIPQTGSRRRRGRDVNIAWRRVAGDADVRSWIWRGDGSPATRTFGRDRRVAQVRRALRRRPRLHAVFQPHTALPRGRAPVARAARGLGGVRHGRREPGKRGRRVRGRLVRRRARRGRVAATPRLRRGYSVETAARLRYLAASSSAEKRSLALQRGDAVVHRGDLLHGVDVKRGERWSWILWYFRGADFR